MREDASMDKLVASTSTPRVDGFSGRKKIKLFKNEPLVARTKVINTELDKMKQNKWKRENIA
jgi:hypothetical protein